MYSILYGELTYCNFEMWKNLLVFVSSAIAQCHLELFESVIQILYHFVPKNNLLEKRFLPNLSFFNPPTV